MLETEKRYRPRPGGGGLERALLVVRPGRRNLLGLGQAMRIDANLLKQVQDLTLAPGFVEVPGQLLVRFKVPEATGERIEWIRVDLVLAAPQALVTVQRDNDFITRAFARFDGQEEVGGDDLLATLTEGVVDAFDQTCTELAKEFEALKEIGLIGQPGSGGPLDEVREQLRELSRGITLERRVLDGLSKRETPLLLSPSRAELRASHDRLTTVLEHVERILEEIEHAAKESAGREVELGVESPEIIEAAADLGKKRLNRLTIGHAITALIGGMAVSFGGVAMACTAGPWTEAWGPERAHLLAALSFPVGFIILIVGKGELFTENFFVPVTGVMTGRGSIWDLLLLWGSTLVFNLVGGAIFAFLISRPGVLFESARQFMVDLAVDKTSMPFWTSLMKGVYAGWLMTVLTWLLLAARGQQGRLWLVWWIGFMIVIGHFNHVVISACEIMMGMALGAPVSIGQWLSKNLVPALLGNLVGGVVFVTVLGYAQARSLRKGEQKLRESAHS